jgi:hypothetical protein
MVLIYLEGDYHYYRNGGSAPGASGSGEGTPFARRRSRAARAVQTLMQEQDSLEVAFLSVTPNGLGASCGARLLVSRGNWPWVSQHLLAVRRAERCSERSIHCKAVGQLAQMGHSAIAVICRLPDSSARHYFPWDQVMNSIEVGKPRRPNSAQAGPGSVQKAIALFLLHKNSQLELSRSNVWFR